MWDWPKISVFSIRVSQLSRDGQLLLYQELARFPSKLLADFSPIITQIKTNNDSHYHSQLLYESRDSSVYCILNTLLLPGSIVRTTKRWSTDTLQKLVDFFLFFRLKVHTFLHQDRICSFVRFHTLTLHCCHCFISLLWAHLRVTATIFVGFELEIILFPERFNQSKNVSTAVQTFNNNNVLGTRPSCLFHCFYVVSDFSPTTNYLDPVDEIHGLIN